MLAIILLGVLVTLGVSHALLTNATLMQAKNLADVQAAQSQAEGGLEFFNYVLGTCSIEGGASGQDLLDALAVALGEHMDGTANLAGQTVVYDGATITVPDIVLSDGRSFQARLQLDASDQVVLQVTGSNGEIDRTVGLAYALTSGGGGGGVGSPGSGTWFFDYGIASRSKIQITGNAKILGANDASEAAMLSATYTDDEAMKMTGNADIAGDVYLSNPNAYATLTGNVSVGGASKWSGDLDDHIHIGIGDVEFPEVDPTVFELFATNIVDSSTSTDGDKTFTNIRIAANTNPTFSGNITINGVIFIEQPNQVHFSGNLTMKGVIVTEDAGDDVYDENTIKFTGNSNFEGVEALPDTAEFHELRQMPGAFVLAPGFGLQFTGNFGAISGTMAADEFKFTGNAGGVISGMVINYSDSAFTLTGNSMLIIDRSADVARSGGTSTPDMPAPPPGFIQPCVLTALVGTYTEYP